MVGWERGLATASDPLAFPTAAQYLSHRTLRCQAFTATSKDSISFITSNKSIKSWDDALSEIGLAYREARLGIEPKHKYEKRLLIAKPIVQSGSTKERHASKPYFLHVGKTESGYYGQILFIPYKYMAGSSNYNEKTYMEYLAACSQINGILSTKLPGGAQ